MWDNRLARPSPRGGLIPRAIAGLDRWLSKQNPAYRSNRRGPPHSCGGPNEIQQGWVKSAGGQGKSGLRPDEIALRADVVSLRDEFKTFALLWQRIFYWGTSE